MDAKDCGRDAVAIIDSFYYSNIAPQSPKLSKFERFKEGVKGFIQKSHMMDEVLKVIGDVIDEKE
jgi:hypothetical protein